MRKGIHIELDELAVLRERAALLCEETKGIIEDYRRLRKWRDELTSMLSTEVIPSARTAVDTVQGQPAERLIVGSHAN